MQEDRFTELALEALLCKDMQRKKAILKEVYEIETERLKNLAGKSTVQWVER